MLQRHVRTCDTILPEKVWAKMGYLSAPKRCSNVDCAGRSSILLAEEQFVRTILHAPPNFVLVAAERGMLAATRMPSFPSHMPSRALALWLQVHNYYELLTFHILFLL